ncbi:hypothetical protein DFH07DRAFT_460273 [Mycena maculata]|uniref:NACHT domain-containing protein n=1 Tax=Mycena maculata TaxID=230809 RepID=A0AAD7NDF2_9AGAR|nr:hypothetical protein DFH07DRAFT_460273 [Mycena maculata]
MFSHSSGIHVNGGNFYDVSGDLRIENTRRGFAQATALNFDPLGQPLGPARTTRTEGSMRMKLPYDISCRPRIQRLEASPISLHSDLSHHSQLPSISHRGYDQPWSISGPELSTTQPNPVPSSQQHDSPSGANITALNSALPWNRSESEHTPRTNIQGGTFIGGNVNHIRRPGEIGIQILRLAAASDAFHDAVERYPQPQCHPQTRTEILEFLLSWSSQVDRFSRVLWLHGPAGAGKSAIAQSLCRTLEAEGRLGASFFFKRGHASRGDGKKLFPTLVYQLVLLAQQWQEHSHLTECKDLQKLKLDILQKIENNPSILDRSIPPLVEKLLVGPSQHLIPGRSLIIVIDGLDECQGHDIQQEILQSIGDAVQMGPCALRFLVASRPEPHLHQMFIRPCLDGFHRRMNINQSFEDVQRYLHNEFDRIHREHHETMDMIPWPWPSPNDVDTLVKKSSGYFIYASTVIKFVDDKDFRPPERLVTIMAMGSAYSVSPPDESPLAALDDLYLQILSQTRPALRPRLLAILTIIAARLNPLRVRQIEELLELKTGDVRLALRGLHSVLKVPPAWAHEDPRSSVYAISVHHASFPDFLNDRTRSGAFCVAGEQQQTDLARKILKAFTYTYDNPSLNHIGHVAWRLGRETLKKVTSTTPAPDLLILLRNFNPDFLFNPLDSERGREMPVEACANMVLDWLKKFRPLPDDSIRLWDDYRFMFYCAALWVINPRRTNTAQNTVALALRASPQLLRILQAYAVLYRTPGEDLWLKIRLLLDFSWDELRTIIRSLRPVTDDRLRELPSLVSDPTLFPNFHVDSILSDLGRGRLTLMEKLIRGEADWNIWLVFIYPTGHTA